MNAGDGLRRCRRRREYAAPQEEGSRNALDVPSRFPVITCMPLKDIPVDALIAHRAITTVNATNTRFVVAAGGYEGATNPSYVFTVQDSG